MLHEIQTGSFSVYDQELARFDLSTMHRMMRHTKNELLNHLDIAKEEYEFECTYQAQNQMVITRFMVKK